LLNGGMPKVTIERFIEGRSFQPEAVAAMGQALEEVDAEKFLEKLNETWRGNP